MITLEKVLTELKADSLNEIVGGGDINVSIGCIYCPTTNNTTTNNTTYNTTTTTNNYSSGSSQSSNGASSVNPEQYYDYEQQICRVP